MITKEFYSNGKLLLTGEYAVLDGAKALAIPTKFGQSLAVSTNKSKQIKWLSLDKENKPWFNASYDLESLTEISSSDSVIAKTLINILIEVRKLSPIFLMDGLGYTIETKLTFPRNWGLGTSSTLINNIAQWANVNPYKLLENTFGGSGYDIACAQHNSAITYQLSKDLPNIEEVTFDPVFKEHLYFVFLNKKQNSREGISLYKQSDFDTETLIGLIGTITDQVLECDTLEKLEGLLNEHEAILSKTLKLQTVRESNFPDYPGSVKSLGAWGGDFILATGGKSSMEYFRQKGYNTIIPFSEMIL